MSDIKFRFQQIMDLSKHKLDEEKTKLQKLTDQRDQLLRRITDKQQQILDSTNKADKESFHFDVHMHTMQLQYIKVIENELDELKGIESQVETMCKAQEEITIKAYQSYKTFEKMKGYHEDKLALEIRRYDQKVLDEHSSIKHSRQSQTSGM